MRITRTAANYLDEGGTRYLLEQIDEIIDEKVQLETGIPEGGTTGQVLAKASNENFDLEWVNQSGGGSGGGSTVTITPTYSGGVKIADYSIDGVRGELHAPNSGGGGGGGTSDYMDLSNKPMINGHTLVGNLSAADLGIPGVTYDDATQSTHGLMSASDKIKLDGIATNANNYVHPTSSGNKHIPSGGSSGQVLGWASDGTAQWITPSGGGGGDLSNYYTKAETDQQIYDAVSAEAAYTRDTYATKVETYRKDETYSNKEVDELIPWVEKEFEVPADGSQVMGEDEYSCWVGKYDPNVSPNFEYEYQTHVLPELTKDTPYIKFIVDTGLGHDPVKWEEARAIYNYYVTDRNGNRHYLDFVSKMYKDMISRMNYAGAIQAFDGTTTYSNASGQNYIIVNDINIFT